MSQLDCPAFTQLAKYNNYPFRILVFQTKTTKLSVGTAAKIL